MSIFPVYEVGARSRGVFGKGLRGRALHQGVVRIHPGAGELLDDALQIGAFPRPGFGASTSDDRSPSGSRSIFGT